MAALIGRKLVADEIAPGDTDQLGLQSAAKDLRVGVAARPGQGPAAQNIVNMDIAVGDQFRTGAYRGGNDKSVPRA